MTLLNAIDSDIFNKKQDVYFDKKFNVQGKRVQPGEYKIIDTPDQMLTTILGSCVAACIRDPKLGIGGMNHFLLPEERKSAQSATQSIASDATRYGNHAMELLINDLLKLGCKRERFEVKVFGGANVSNMNVVIGQQNAEFILQYIKDEDLKLEAHDLGGHTARRIYFFPNTGKVSRFLFSDIDKVRQRETAHRNTLNVTEQTDDIELFS